MPSDDNEPGRSEREHVAKGVYDHLRWLSDVASANYQAYVQKTHKILTIDVVLFTALGYGLTQLEAMHSENARMMFLAMGVGFLAAILIAISFYLGIRMLGITETSVAGIGKLRASIKDGTIARLRLAIVWAQLSENLTTAIVENQKREDNRKPFGRWLNVFTLAGYIAVVVFVLIVSSGKYILGLMGEQ